MTATAFVDLAFFATLVAASIRIATPILLAALGEAISESAGVLNVGGPTVLLRSVRLRAATPSLPQTC